LKNWDITLKVNKFKWIYSNDKWAYNETFRYYK